MRTLYERIYAVVRRIPRGSVATYGQIAALAGIPFHARQVGYALHSAPSGVSIPWHRVINAQGRISTRAGSGGDLVQRALLEKEGITFDSTGRARLDVFQWRPRGGNSSPRQKRRRSRRR